MSVQKLETVKKARKDQGHCSKCHVEIKAGDGYRYWYPGFRSNYKIVRCMKTECFPKPSERETSKAATLLAAQENFDEVIDSLDTVEDITDAVHEVGTAVEEVRDEYQEALDQWENGNEQLQEKVDHYEEQAYEPVNWEWDGPDEPDLCLEHEAEDGGTTFPERIINSCPACQEKRDEWLEEIRSAAREVVGNVETA